MLRIVNQGTTPEMFIYGEIGPSAYGMIGADSVVEALANIGPVPAINVRLNTPGGDVFEGIAIYNALLRNPAKVNCYVDGLAASAGSFVAMAGDRIIIAPSAMLMVHNAWTVAVGNKTALRNTADTLDKVDATLAQTYAARTGLSVDEVQSLLDAETWMTAEEAVEKGFADVIGEPLNVSAAVRPGRFRNTPAQFLSGTPVESRTETPVSSPRRTAARLQTLNARARVRV